MNNFLLRIGLTTWSHNGWQQNFYGQGTKPVERLEKYSQVFNIVEGNSTFHSPPSLNTVRNWRAATPDNFRFMFKLPQAITHQQMLQGCKTQLEAFIKIMEPLHERIGQWTVQLPPKFGPHHLQTLKQFCTLFPHQFSLGIEVRHPGFYTKSDDEKAFNQWLIQEGYNRIIVDNRALFSEIMTPDHPQYSLWLTAQQQKTKLPVHAISTANHPTIRFFGHPVEKVNDKFFAPWLNKIPQWINEVKQPYLLIRTVDNQSAPQLAKKLYHQLQNHCPLPALSNFPANNDQSQIQMF